MKKLIVLVALLGVATFSLGDAHAAAGLRSIGVGAGYASPENIDGTWTVNFRLDFGLPVMNLHVQPFVGYWTKDLAEIPGASASFSDWMVGGNLKYTFPTSAPKFHPYIQGGIAAHILSSEVSTSLFGQPLSLSASDTKIGIQGGAGFVVDAGERWGIFGEGNYHMVSDFNQWMIGGGVQINL